MSGGGRYRYLFSPLRIGPVVVGNRIVFSAHLTNYAEDGLPTQQHADYYAARAAGGVGLIITEEHSTHPTDWPYEKLIHGFHRAVIPGYQKMTAAAHAYGVPIFAQLNHNGGQASSMFSRRPVWAPSPVPDPMFREVPKAVERHEIAEIVAGYGTVAGHCAEGGFDGVELQCSHSSIVRGFLSPATNKRTDAYGGSLAARARILLEIVDAVREAIGPDRALGVRICGDELIEGGSTLDEAVEVAQMMEATGQVDYINTSIGVATATLFMIEASMSIPPGYALFIANAMRRAVSLPVIGVGRIKDPVQAERALADGHCDLVGVVRGQIADPDFAAKARSGHGTEIRTCLSCNQECVGRMGLNRWLGCIENPRTGREAVPLPPPSRRGRRVIVVGGGPAGLQAAATAAHRGHRVTLLERRPRTGGQVAEAATVPSRSEFLDVVRNLAAECQRNGVEIRTGVAATAQGLLGESPDAVVLATGARPQPPYWAAGLPTRRGRARRARRPRRAGRAGGRGRRPRLPPGHQRRRAAGRPGLRGGDHYRRHGRGPGSRHHPRHGDLQRAGARQGNPPGHRPGGGRCGRRRQPGRAARRGAALAAASSDRRARAAALRLGGVRGPSGARGRAMAGAAGAPFEVHRAGDCVTPRRAHAAVIEGHRAAVAL